MRLDAVVVHFEEKILLPQNLAVLPRDLFRLRKIVVLMNRHRALAFEARAHPDQPARMFGEMLVVDARLVIGGEAPRRSTLRRGRRSH